MKKSIDQILWEKSNLLEVKFEELYKEGSELIEGGMLDTIKGVCYISIAPLFVLSLNIVIFGGLFLFLSQFVK